MRSVRYIAATLAVVACGWLLIGAYGIFTTAQDRASGWQIHELPSHPVARNEAFRNRTIHTFLDPQTLASIPDDELEQAVVDFVFSKLEDHYDQERQIVNALPQGARALYLTWIVEAEVNNGGFNQYYWNTDGRFAAEAIEAFEFFGADQHAALMREANAVRAAEAKAVSKFKERGTLEAFSESYQVSKLGPLDKRFYQLGESLSALRIAKIRELPERFSGS